ncbi:hypothetical protein INR49_027411 [Caranx melampygus]|nr:hypothetical protein INR49_027411 [Caranx melampygus]
MAKKSLSKKSVKSLFSRSEANLDESVERDASKNEGEKKKKFKFFKLKTKSKNSSSPEKAGHGSQQVLSAAEPSNCAGEDGEAWAAGKKAALYSTAPRSKGKEFSYSEMDLRKPKRFGTFSFGLKKRKRRDEDSLSKSTFGLHSPGIGEHEETNLDLSQVELDQSKTKMTFSMSQPELDTSDTFDIPSPPAVGKNQSGSSFTIPDQPPQSFVSENTLINSSAISDAYEDTPKAPIASIEEFQLDDEELNAPVHHNSSDSAAKSPAPVTHTESVSVVDTQPAPCIPADQPPVAPDTSDQRAVTAAAVDHCDNDSPQQPYIKTEISLPDSINETLTHPQPDAPDIADSAAPSNERFLTSADSKPDATNTDSTPVPRNDISTHSVTEGVSDSHVKRSAPEAANSVKTTSDISNEKTTPRNEDAVYGALYESLFPESFTTEIMSSLSALPAQIHTEVRHVNTKPEHVMVKTLEHHKETTITYSCLPPSHDSVAHGLDQADSGYASTHDNVKVPPRCERFTSYRTSTSTDFQANTDQVQHRCLPSSLSSASEAASRNFPYSELTPSHSELRLDSSSPIHHTVGSVPVSQNSAPPATDYVTSQGTDTQVTDSKRRVILVKESVSDEASPDSGCPSPVPDKMSAGKSLELKIEAREGFGSGQTDIASPVYLSVGSDDGSAMEIYYSAEEDNAEESGEEEMYTVDEREETYVVDGMKGLEQGKWQKEEEAREMREICRS